MPYCQALGCGHVKYFNYSLRMVELSKKAISKRLNQVLNETGVTLEVFGGVADKSRQAAKAWVTTGRISKTSLEQIADYFNYSLLWLLTGEGPKNKSDVVQTEPQGITIEEKEILNRFRQLTLRQKKAVKVMVEALIPENNIKHASLTEQELDSVRKAATAAVDSRAIEGNRKLSPELRADLIEQTVQEMLHSQEQSNNQDYQNQKLKQKRV